MRENHLSLCHHPDPKVTFDKNSSYIQSSIFIGKYLNNKWLIIIYYAYIRVSFRWENKKMQKKYPDHGIFKSV